MNNSSLGSEKYGPWMKEECTYALLKKHEFEGDSKKLKLVRKYRTYQAVVLSYFSTGQPNELVIGKWNKVENWWLPCPVTIEGVALWKDITDCVSIDRRF